MIAITFLLLAILLGIASYFSYLKACHISTVSTEIVDQRAFEQNFTMPYQEMVKRGIVKEVRTKNIYFLLSGVARVLAIIFLALNIIVSL